MKVGSLTSTKEYLDFAHPERYVFEVESIARGLSKVCRFSGQGRWYSVAEHSVLVSRQFRDDLRLEALFHDASEAYMGDLTTQLKALVPGYRMLEQKVQAEIMRQFGLDPLPLLSIKQADCRLLAVEQFDVMDSYDDWSSLVGYDDSLVDSHPEIECLNHEAAYSMFMEAYAKYL